jgi:hypothetical protein
MTAQSDTIIPNAEQQRKAERAYAEMVARVEQGDMTVDFRAFRTAGATQVRPARQHTRNGGARRLSQHRGFSAIGRALSNSAKRALERNYASPIAQYDAMTAYQALGEDR